MKKMKILMNCIPAEARVTIITLAVSGLIVITAMIYALTFNAAKQITADADDKLELLNSSLAASTQTWLNFQVKSLDQLVKMPDITSMSPGQQKPILKIMARVYDHMYLVSTTDLKGMNIARNDDNPPTDYRDRPWFQGAVSGHTTYQNLISRTTNLPALVVATPIRNQLGSVIGVGMFAAHLTELSRHVQASSIGKSGYAYVIDDQNRLIAHPDKDLTAKFQDFSQDPPIAALRKGHRGLFEYTDQKGVSWLANINALNNGWGIIVKQKREETMAPLNDFQHLAIIILILAPIFLLMHSWMIIRHALQPIIEKTDTDAPPQD